MTLLEDIFVYDIFSPNYF